MSKNILFTCYPTQHETFKNTKSKVIPGVILIYSCHRHKDTRLKKFTLSKRNYNGWKVYIIIGDPNLDVDYIVEDNIITLKCEDSYIHLTKKVILAFKILFHMYTITEGILRCGDDLVFSEAKLEKFTKIRNKPDYMGRAIRLDRNMKKIHDNFMPDYFNDHPNDLLNPLNGIPYNLEEMQQFNKVPTPDYISGVLIYFSKDACDVLIDHMEQINWNVFLEYEEYGFPYIIEDIAIGYILNINNIFPYDYMIYCDTEEELKSDKTGIAVHTNEYK